MESSLSLASSLLPHKGLDEFFIQAEQDGLFFGLKCLQQMLENPHDGPEITACLQEGECVIKGQTLLGIDLKGQDFKKEDLLSVVSYLSGAYTLISCFMERNFDFSIMAGSTPDFFLSEWEEQAILQAGGEIQKPPERASSSSERDIQQLLERGERKIILNGSKLPKEKIKSLLRLLPPSVERSLMGAFYPADLEEFRFLRLKSVYPLCLQGYFPRLKMKICESA